MPWLPQEGGDEDDAPATLGEIEARLCAFDPLPLALRNEPAAISIHAWLSLAAQGMMLHFVDHRGALRHFELRPGARGGAQVWLGERQLSRFSTMQGAIEAVDQELPRHGDPASARTAAPWRRAPIPPALRSQLDALVPPRLAADVGTAIAHLALDAALRAAAPRPRRS